ncbi:MAG: extracellular solute-binding protein [Candidatus Caldarchaeum sp.]
MGEKVSRRAAVKVVGAGVVGAVLGGAAGFALRTPETGGVRTVERTVERTVDRTVERRITVTVSPTPAQPSELKIITWGGPWKDAADMLAKKAEQELGVKLVVDLHAGPSGPSLRKQQAAWDPKAPLWDLFWGTAVVGFQGAGLAPPAVFAPIDESRLENVKAIPRDFKGYLDNKLYWVALYSYGCVWVYRRDLVQTPIRSFNDLLKPEFKGKIAVAYPTYLAGSMLTAAAISGGGSEKNIDPGFEFFKSLARAGNIATVVRSDSDVLRVLTTGDAAVCWTLTGNGLSLFRRGVPVANALTYEDTKTPILLDVVAVIDGPNKEASFKFLDWLFSPDILAPYVSILGYLPSHPKALIDPEAMKWNLTLDQIQSKGHVIDFVHVAREIDRWVTRWDAEITPLL